MPLVYAFHLGFFAVFFLRLAGRGAAPAPDAVPTPGTSTAADPRAGGLLGFHAAAFFVLYFGLGQALFMRGRAAPLLFVPQPVLGGSLIVAGAALLAWTLLLFRSWRLLARIEEGHQLCTSGPFRLVRHPIYLSLDLLALGTVLWVPGPIVVIGAVLVAVGGDLRARTEERLLAQVFGDEYRDYQRRVPRTLPGIY
jgi:protein-S-isoprenylcysteine O-methyltransferase Ste14